MNNEISGIVTARNIIIRKEDGRGMRCKTDGLRERVQKTILRESRGTKCDIPRLSKETGIPEATLRRYKREPDMIPLGRLFAIAKAMNSSPQEIGYAITGEKI